MFLIGNLSAQRADHQKESRTVGADSPTLGTRSPPRAALYIRSPWPRKAMARRHRPSVASTRLLRPTLLPKIRWGA